MKLTSAVPLALVLAASFTACSSDSRDFGGLAGAAGSSAGAATVAGNGGQSPSTAGSAGQATAGSGAGGGSGGASAGAAGSSGGSAGSGGAAAGAAGTGGASGAAGSAGGGGAASFWGANGPKKQWTCPPGPFAAQTMSAATDICAGFKYNYSYNEGPTWIASQNAFFFSNFTQGSDTGGDIIKYTIGGACEVWIHDAKCNGLGVSPSGNLLGSCQGPRAVMEYDVTTKVGRAVATMAGGKLLDSPNDLIARSDGNVYFSNTTYELGNRPQGLGQALVRIDPKGVVSVIEAGGLNGVALSPDEKKLYVVGKGVFSLDDAGVPTKAAGQDPGGDGIAVDCAGTISKTGTNSAFGGADGKTLIAVGGGTSAKTYQMSVPGLP